MTNQTNQVRDQKSQITKLIFHLASDLLFLRNTGAFQKYLD